MGNLLESIGALIVLYPAWSYIILGAGFLLQGELALVFAVSLIIGGKLGWIEFFATALISFLFVETLVYIVGRIIRTSRFGWRLSRKLEHNEKIQIYKRFLHTSAAKLLLLSRFLVGVNFLILILSGWSKVRFGKFFKAYISGLLLWLFIMTGIVYAFLSGIYSIPGGVSFKKFEIGIAVVIIVLFIAEFALKRAFKKFGAIDEKATSIGRLVDSHEEKRSSSEER